MYPEHWLLDGNTGSFNNTNMGFSMKPASVENNAHVHVNMPVDPAKSEFSITMDCIFRSADVFVVVPLPDGFYRFIVFSYYTLDEQLHMQYCTIDSEGNPIDVSDLFIHSVVEEKYHHISIIGHNDMVNLYINGTMVTSVGEYTDNVSAYASMYYQQYIDSEMLSIFNVSNGGPMQCKNIKYYDTKISKQQIWEDYYQLCAHYLFDGSGSVYDDTYRKECDCSGGVAYDAVFGGSPALQLELTSTGNHLRDYSVSIPTGGGINFPTPQNESFFINFWAYFVDGDSNFNLFKKSTFSISGMVEDVGYSLHYGVSSEEAPVSLGQVSVSTWYMISIGYDPVDGDGDLHIYINGEKVTDVTVDSSTVDFIGDGSATMYAFPGVLSDYKQYLHIPSDAEILRMYTGEVAIDDRGTFYASKLTEDETMSTFGFTRGEIQAKGFELLEEEDSSTAKFDLNSGMFKVRDFKQI